MAIGTPRTYAIASSPVHEERSRSSRWVGRGFRGQWSASYRGIAFVEARNSRSQESVRVQCVLQRTGRSWWTDRPALRAFCYAGKPLPIDVPELLALAAPRPFINIAALNDCGFGVEEEPLTRPAWDSLARNVQKIYALYGAEDNFQNVLHLNGHDFHDAMRERAYAFVDRAMRGPS
jgi:hypothetical protein